MEGLGECKWRNFRVEIGSARFSRLGSVVRHAEVKSPINIEDLVLLFLFLNSFQSTMVLIALEDRLETSP